MKNIIFIIGPTGCGKSHLAINLAKDLNCEIINADAFQVYKEVNIGNNKISKKEMNGIKHHLLDIISISDHWNIKAFQEVFFNLALNSNKNFIVVGGSNLYIDCVIKNYNLQNEINAPLPDISHEEKWNMLYKLDEETAKKVDKNNIRRIDHKLKIAISNQGKTSSVLNNEKVINPFIIKIEINRKDLYCKINTRVESMINDGWVDEVRNILKICNPDSQIFQAIGYNEIKDSILNNSELNIDLIKKKTRNYAKRQETWCRNKFEIDYIYKNNEYANLLAITKEFLVKNGNINEN
ncbi:MAG: tRNA (adenosine(37)-N6)-dimethylallyltransferase MiaA [Malacoplasma sp.]